MQNTRNFFQYVINHLQSEVKYWEKFHRPTAAVSSPWAQLLFRFETYIREDRSEERNCGETKWKRGKPNREL